jgi:8-oxo-dGTP pyrophosphatase MutT (NUDIX family)
MQARTWKPSVTVAAVIEREGRFLLVEEEADGRRVYNQPAGHWEPGETLADACAREALEETAWHCEPQHLVGVYRWHYAPADNTFLRFTFACAALEHDAARALDREIVRAVWLDMAEVRALVPAHRSPLVMRCIDDYAAGRRFPLDVITHVD